MVVINELLLKIPCKKSVLSDHIEIDRLKYFIFSSFGTFQVNWPDFLSIKIYLDFIDYRYCNSGKGDLYRRRFIDQKRPVCVKGSHESLVSIWVQICQQNALTVNPFSPQGKQYKFTSGSKSPLTHTFLVLNGCRIPCHKNLINENWKFCVPHREKYIQYNKLMLLLYIIIYNTLFQ